MTAHMIDHYRYYLLLSSEHRMFAVWPEDRPPHWPAPTMGLWTREQFEDELDQRTIMIPIPEIYEAHPNLINIKGQWEKMKEAMNVKPWCALCHRHHSPDCEVHHYLMADGRCNCDDQYIQTVEDIRQGRL